MTGMPRSGTSWFGQIINSSPDTVFRTEPLFAYRFKNRLDPESSKADIEHFFEDLAKVDDDFMLQKKNIEEGIYPVFPKRSQSVLAYKTTRHHELLDRFLATFNDVYCIGVVRHPCGAINSWLKSDREFASKGCEVERDWRSGGCRKDGYGEYWGFDDWLRITRKFVDLDKVYDNFVLVKYSAMVADGVATAREMFDRVGLEFCEQTRDFLLSSQSRHDEDPYSVYKDRTVLESWKYELDSRIAEEIMSDSVRYGLEEFLS